MSTDDWLGPLSYLAVCSEPGIHWISDRVGGLQYGQLANEFFDQVGVLQQLKFTRERVTEPDEKTARTWLKGTSTTFESLSPAP